MVPTYRRHLLMGPDIANIPESVSLAMGVGDVGHFDGDFLRQMTDCKQLLRQSLRTHNDATFPFPGSGMAGLEFILANFAAPGAKVVICNNGSMSERMAELAAMMHVEVVRPDLGWGRPLDVPTLETILKKHRPALVLMPHGDHTTGMLQPIEGFAAPIHAAGALFGIDCASTLGGCPLLMDHHDIDLAWAGTHKCLNCPPGLVIASMSARALTSRGHRIDPIKNLFLDLDDIVKPVMGRHHAFHHELPIGSVYALTEGLNLVMAEGLEKRWHRHKASADHLIACLTPLGFSAAVEAKLRLPTVVVLNVPAHIDVDRLRVLLLKEHGIEIGGGVQPGQSRQIRVGLMGINSRSELVNRLVDAITEILDHSQT